MVICQGSTRSELPWGLLALYRRTLGSERHRYAIAWPDKLGTYPMAYGGFIMDAAAELGRNPVSKHQIQPESRDDQADAGRDGWTRLARPNSQARTGTGECSFSLFSWPRAGSATLPGWSILCYMWWPYIHTCCRPDAAIIHCPLNEFITTFWRNLLSSHVVCTGSSLYSSRKCKTPQQTELWVRVGAVSPEERYWGRDRYRWWCLLHSAYSSTTCTSFPHNYTIWFDSVSGQSATDQDFFHIMHDDVNCPLSHLLVFVVDGSFVYRRTFSWRLIIIQWVLCRSQDKSSMDQPGKVANPACGQLNRENENFPVRVRAWEFDLVRRVRQSRPASVSLFISILRLNLVLPYGIPPEFRGGVHLFISNIYAPSGQSRVCRVKQWRTDGVHCRESAGTGPVNLKVVPNERGLPWQVTMDRLICASLSHAHYWYEGDTLKVPAIDYVLIMPQRNIYKAPTRAWKQKKTIPCVVALYL